MTRNHLARIVAATALLLGAAHAMAAPEARIAELAASQKQPLLDTLKALVHIESGSRDLEGLDKLANLIADRLRALGGEVELIEPAARSPTSTAWKTRPRSSARWSSAPSRARARRRSC